jgi:hypothetical protein
MPPNMIMPADVARISVSGTFQDATWANIFHCYLPGNTLSPTTLGGFAEDFGVQLADSLFYAAQANDMGANLAKVDLSDGTTITSGSSAIDASGTDTSTGIIAGGAVVVSWLGAWHYRGGKPRTYVTGLTDGWVTDSTHLDAGRQASLQSAAISLLELVDAMSGTGYPSVSLGVLLGNSPTAEGDFAPYTGARVNGYVGSQRRRNRAH